MSAPALLRLLRQHGADVLLLSGGRVLITRARLTDRDLASLAPLAGDLITALLEERRHGFSVA